MSNTDTKRIVTTLDADITPMQAKLKSLQADIDKLEKSILKIATKELGNQTPYNSMPALQRTLSHSPDIRDALPQLQPLLASLDTAIKQMNGLSRLSGNPNAGFTSYDGVAKGGPAPESPREEAIRGLSVQRASAVMQAQVDALQKQARGDDELRRKKNDLVEEERRHLLKTVFNARSLSQLGALSNGNVGPLGRNLVAGALQQGFSGGTNIGGVFGSGMAAIQLLRGPKTATSANALAQAGTVAGDGGDAGIMGTAMSMVKAIPIGGWIAALVGAGIMGEEFYNKVHTAAHVTSYDLRATAPGGLSPDQAMSLTANLGGLQGSAPQYLYHPATGLALGHQLMQMGVGAGSVVGATKATFSLARAIGADDSQIPTLGALTGTLMGKQGQSLDQTTMVFQQLVKQAKAFGVGTDKLIDSFSTLEQATNGVIISIGGADSGVSGLAAVQKLVGGNINAGALMAPSMGATGANAIQAAALLFGGDVGKFTHAQGNSGVMFDAIGKFLKNTNPGKNPMQQQVDIEMLKSLGLLDFGSIAPQDQARIVNLLLNGNGKQAQDLATKLQKKEDLVGPDVWRKQMINDANDQTTHIQKIAINTEAANVTLGTLHHDLRDIYGAVQPGSSSSDNPGNPANTAQRARLTPGMAERAKFGGSLGFLGGQPNLAAMGYTNANVGNVPFDLAGIPTAGPYGVQPIQNGYLPSFAGPHPAGSVEVRNAQGQYSRVPPQYMAAFVAASKQSGIPLSVLLAQASAETGGTFNPGLTSSAGAQGLAQFMPGTFKQMAAVLSKQKGSAFYGQKADPFNPMQSIEAQALYDSQLLKQFGNMQDALAAYNAGPGNYRAGEGYASGILKSAQSVDIVVTGTLKVTDQSGKQVGTVTIPPHHVRAPVADSKTKAHPAKSGPHQQKPAPPPPKVHRSS